MNDDKQLQLKTNNCGKPFTTIPGVVFGRPHPTQAEIDYAAELLDDWVTRNENNIENYLEKFFELDQTNEPDTEIDLPKGGKIEMNQERKYNPRKGGFTYNNKSVSVYLGPEDGRRFTFNLDGELWSLDWDGAWTGPWANVVKLDKKIMQTAMDFMKQHAAYRALQKEVEDLTSELNLCKM